MIFIPKNNTALPMEFSSIENLIRKICVKEDPKKVEIEIAVNQEKNLGLHVKKHLVKFKDPEIMFVTKNNGLGNFSFIGYAICEKRETELIKTK